MQTKKPLSFLSVLTALAGLFSLCGCNDVWIAPESDSYVAYVTGEPFYMTGRGRVIDFSMNMGSSRRLSNRDLQDILDIFSRRVNPDFFEAHFEIDIDRARRSGRTADVYYYVALQSGPDPDSYVFYQTGPDFIIEQRLYSCDAYLRVEYPGGLLPEHTSATYDEVTAVGGVLTDENINNIITDLNQPRYLSPGWVSGDLEIDVFETLYPDFVFPRCYYDVWWDDAYQCYLWEEARTVRSSVTMPTGERIKVMTGRRTVPGGCTPTVRRAVTVTR